ncbi:MAG: DsrE family protein [Armatimonadetes bacterium]|nr:DsrE family protein [Armatimonadota bacterium]
MKILFILNGAPYGDERTYNALRLILSLSKKEEIKLKVFLMADAVSSGKDFQETPQGYYNIGRMLKGLVKRNIPIGVCGTCMDARGLKEEEFIEGVKRSSMDELTDWTIESDKVISF